MLVTHYRDAPEPASLPGPSSPSPRAPDRKSRASPPPSGLPRRAPTVQLELRPLAPPRTSPASVGPARRSADWPVRNSRPPTATHCITMGTCVYHTPCPFPRITLERCSVAYQPNWSLAIYWKHNAHCLLRSATSRRDRCHRTRRSSRPRTQTLRDECQPIPTEHQAGLAPSSIIRSVKGRLQHHIRETSPASFRRNYSVHSIGSANSDAIQEYVATQIDHHKMADERAEAPASAFQYCDRGVDLKQVRRSSYGEFIFNLHIVLTH